MLYSFREMRRRGWTPRDSILRRELPGRRIRATQALDGLQLVRPKNGATLLALSVDLVRISQIVYTIRKAP